MAHLECLHMSPHYTLKYNMMFAIHLTLCREIQDSNAKIADVKHVKVQETSV